MVMHEQSASRRKMKEADVSMMHLYLTGGSLGEQFLGMSNSGMILRNLPIPSEVPSILIRVNSEVRPYVVDYKEV